jgi:inward rectifier potassium channel
MSSKNWYKIVATNSPDLGYKHGFKDIYHYLMRSSLPRVFQFYVIIFLTINTLFAFIYLAVPGSISGPHTFRNTFFFSVQTFSTVGYGTVSPQNLYGNIIVVMEIMTGVLTVALTAGLAFAKFSKPSAKLIYSKNILLTTFDNEPVLMFRLANSRGNQITSANIELHRVYLFTTKEGNQIVRFKSLKLIRDYHPVFALSWSVYHPIDKDSPFFGMTHKELKESRDEFYVVFNGIDSAFSQTIHDVHYYKMDHLLTNHRFADILHRDNDGTRYIDYEKFDQTVPDGL